MSSSKLGPTVQIMDYAIQDLAYWTLHCGGKNIYELHEGSREDYVLLGNKGS